MIKPPSIAEFLRMIVAGWFTRLSGTLGVLCGAVGLFWDNRIARLAFYLASALGLMMAVYGAWRSERQQRCKIESKRGPKPQPLLKVVLVDRPGLISIQAGFYLRNVGSPALDVKIDDLKVGDFVAKFRPLPDLLSAVDGGVEKTTAFEVRLVEDEHTNYGENIHALFLQMPPEIIYHVDVVVRYWDVERHYRYRSTFSLEIDCVNQSTTATFVSQDVDGL